MQITIVNDRSGVPKVHRTGCRDVRPNDDAYVLGNCASRTEVAQEWWGDLIEESGGTAEEYIGEMHFPPCTKGLPRVIDGTTERGKER